MRFEDLFDLDITQREPLYVGLTVDGHVFSAPEGVRALAFVYRGDGDEADEDLVDVLIACTLAGVDAILEIPADAGALSAPYLVAVAANADFSLSCLPPEAENDSASWSAYLQRLDAMTKAYLAAGTFSKLLYPVTTVLQGMFREVAGGDTMARRVTDHYTARRFSPEVLSDAAWERIDTVVRPLVLEGYGGEEAFRTMAWSLFQGIHGHAETYCRDIAASLRGESTQRFLPGG